MPDIALATLNAKYIHSAFGLRCLFANMAELQPQTCIVEFDIHQRPVDIAEAILSRNPRILGLGVYIWNVGPTTELVGILKRVRPDLTIILGGPEVSYQTDSQPIVRATDYVITGEADLKFAEICRHLLAGQQVESKVIPADLPDFATLTLPYSHYNEADIAHRILYVEASRGCPFSCEFCLSSLEIPVRQAPLDAFLHEMGSLLDRGARHLKFVDRTFNLNVSVSQAILQFLLDRYQPGHFFHFEMVPDRLPDSLRKLISRFPPGALQLEVGVQTFNPDVASLISRRQNYQRLEENLRFLRSETGVHIHADLIFGLPGESLASFAAGFDKLVSLNPQEIQAGMLKRLRGAPISRHDTTWDMAYSPHPPYEILRNKLIDFHTMQKLRRFARYWDMVANSGNFIETAPLLWSPVPSHTAHNDTSTCRTPSPFHRFMRFSEWLYTTTRRTDGIALIKLMELLFDYLQEQKLRPEDVAGCLWRDYQRGGRFDKPTFLKAFLHVDSPPTNRERNASSVKRQARHWHNAQPS